MGLSRPPRFLGFSRCLLAASPETTALAGSSRFHSFLDLGRDHHYEYNC